MAIPEICITETGVKSYLVPGTWPYDKYPEMPELDARAAVTIFDEDGPGIVSLLHISDYILRPGANGEKEASSEEIASGLHLRVYYDGAETPDIDMPLFDFLGDASGSVGYYSTVYFSKVMKSHNFRLPIPFRYHLRIQVENDSDWNLMGYTEVQYERYESLPEDTGYLYADYRCGTAVLPDDILELMNAEGCGHLAAHWFRIAGDAPLCKDGEVLCEANNEFYVDGEGMPRLEYLGTEDHYGYSWGFFGQQSDGFAAIIEKKPLPGGGARVAMLRCRTQDRVRFEKSLRIVMDYRQEYFSRFSVNHLHTDMEVFAARGKLIVKAQYSSCCYYYLKK